MSDDKALRELRDCMSRYRRAKCNGHFSTTSRAAKGRLAYCDGENHLEDCPVEVAWQDVVAAHNVLDPLLEHGR